MTEDVDIVVCVRSIETRMLEILLVLLLLLLLNVGLRNVALLHMRKRVRKIMARETAPGRRHRV